MNSLTIASQLASLNGLAGISARLRAQYQALFSPMKRLVAAVPPNASVLDAGCGEGLFLTALAATGTEGRLVGYDASAGRIECANAMLAEREDAPVRSNLRFQQLQLHNSHPRGDFEVVSLLGLIPKLPANLRAKAFRCAVDHLAPGGQILYQHKNNLLRGNSAELAQVKMWANLLGLHMVRDEHVGRFPRSYNIVCFRKPSQSPGLALRTHAGAGFILTIFWGEFVPHCPISPANGDDPKNGS